MHQNRQNLLVNSHIERFLTFFPVTDLLNILCIFHAFWRENRKEESCDCITKRFEIPYPLSTRILYRFISVLHFLSLSKYRYLNIKFELRTSELSTRAFFPLHFQSLLISHAFIWSNVSSFIYVDDALDDRNHSMHEYCNIRYILL